jgi:superfamily II DNA or RNA helicase
MHIKIKVGPTTSTILKANTQILTAISDLCSYQKVSERAKKYSKACQSGWDGKISLVDRFSGNVPTGLVPKIVRWLKDEGHTVELEKHLPSTNESKKLEEIHAGPRLRVYQREAVSKFIRAKRGILQLPTGAGKTEIAVGIVGELKRNTIFFVHTKELVKQAKERFELYYPTVKIGSIGDGNIDPGPITIASIQTISSWLIPPKEPVQKSTELTTVFQERYQKYLDKMEEWKTLNDRAKKFLSKFPVAIFDECHHLAADTFFTCAQACEGAEYLLALSATPFRDDGADLLIEAGSGSTIYSLTLSDLVKMGYLLPAEIHIHDYPPLPPMNLSSSYAEQYKVCITQNEDRNAKIVKIIKEEVSKGKTILVICREIEHINLLSEACEFEKIDHRTVHAKTKDREKRLEAFKNGDVPVLIGSTIFDEGVDIPAVDVIILAGAGKSRVKSYQRIGRSLRIFPGKTFSIIHDFRDQVKPFYYHSLERLKLYNAEDCFTVIKHYKKKERNVIKKQLMISKKLEMFDV